MESLLRGLTEPTIKADGTMRPPSAVMLRAAKAIQELHKLNADSQRILLEKQAECDKAHQYGIEYMLRYQNASRELDLTDYQEIMNKDRE